MFKVSRVRNRWVMQLDMELMSPNSITRDMVFKWSNQEVQRLSEELNGRPGVKRMSYDTWYWTSHHDLERFFTFWYLKHGAE